MSNSSETNRRRRLNPARIGIILAVLAAALVVPDNNAMAASQDGPYYLVNQANGRCLDAAAQYNGANGTPIQLWDCYPPSQTNQMWYRVWVDDYHFQLVSAVAGNRCLDAYSMHITNGTPLQLWDCLGPNQGNQIWSIRYTDVAGIYSIWGLASSRVVDADAGRGGLNSNGTKVQLWDYIGGAQTNQRWRLVTPNGF
jgi:hypothetical protein